MLPVGAMLAAVSLDSCLCALCCRRLVTEPEPEPKPEPEPESESELEPKPKPGLMEEPKADSS